jgi:hypothetical protein
MRSCRSHFGLLIAFLPQAAFGQPTKPRARWRCIGHAECPDLFPIRDTVCSSSFLKTYT